MMCALLAVLFLGLIGLALFVWVVFRVMVLSGMYDEPDYDDIVEDAPPMLLECPRCGHRCEICFKGVLEETGTIWHCSECDWIGARVK